MYLEGCDLQQCVAVSVDTGTYLTLADALRKASSCSDHVITLCQESFFLSFLDVWEKFQKL